MKIPERLKKNLIADVENICEINLDDQTKTDLKRAFEITVGTGVPELKIQENDDQIILEQVNPTGVVIDRIELKGRWTIRVDIGHMCLLRGIEEIGPYLEKIQNGFIDNTND